MKNWQLLRALKLRKQGIRSLAAAIGSNRCHVSQVLNNIPGRGGQTRRKLAKLMTAEELKLAGWDANGNQVAQDARDRITRVDESAKPFVAVVPKTSSTGNKVAGH